MPRLLLAVALLASAGPAWALRAAVDVKAFADRCPVIVRGKIVRVEEPTDNKGTDAVAEIEIGEVVKNDLKDVPLKAGGKLKVRMAATVKPTTELRVYSSSKAQSYPEGTAATWLVLLDKSGEFRIGQLPEQKQREDVKAGDLSGRAKIERIRRVGDEPKAKDEPGVVRGTVTVAEWVKGVTPRHKEREEEEQRIEREAEECPVLAAAFELADGRKLDPAAVAALMREPEVVRRGLFQREVDLPLKGERYVEVARHVLEHDPEATVRTSAANRLGREMFKGVAGVGEALAVGLKDESPDVRLFACQSLWCHGDKTLAPLARPLLADKDKHVRRTAIRTLGMLGDTLAVPAVVKLYEKEQPPAVEAYTFADCLARLGETEVSTAAAVKAMESDNWNVRYFAVKALEHVKEDAAVPAAVACLGRELEWVIAGGQNTGFDERIYTTACEVLAKRTGRKADLNPLIWADWWEDHRKGYDGAEWKIDREAAKKAFAEHLSKKK